MRNEFTAIIEWDGEWYIAYCPEIPGANGQGKTKDEARESLASDAPSPSGQGCAEPL
jgi:predicted RNase H-like HicB family nuclease